MKTSIGLHHRDTSVTHVMVLITSVAALACAAVGPSDEPTETSDSEDVQLSAADASRQVLDFRNQHMTALTDRRDMERIISHLTENAAYLPPSGQSIVGHDAIRAYLTDFFSGALFGVNFHNVRTLVDGDLAVLHDTYELVVVPHSGAAPSQHSGEDVWVLRRVDGEWRIALVMWTEASPVEE